MKYIVEFWESFKIALGALWANKLRTFLTLLGMIIGVATVIGIFSLTQGLDKYMSDEIGSLGTGVLYIEKFSWMDHNSWDEFRNRKDLTMTEVEALRGQMTLAEAVSPSAGTSRTVRRRNKSIESVRIVGTNHEKTGDSYPEFGRDLSLQDVENRRNVCVIGWDVADQLFEYESPVGEYINISGYPFQIIGVLEKQGEFFGQNRDSEIRIPIGVFQKLYGSRRSLTIQIKVADEVPVEDAIDEIRGILRRVRQVPPAEKDDFSINQIDMIMDLYNNLTGALKIAIIFIGLISVVVGAIGIMNILLVSVAERVKEVGVRKALGAQKRSIMTQFIIEALTLSFFGGAAGLGIGFSLGALVAAVSPLPSTMSVAGIIFGFGISFVVGILAGIYPAKKASSLNPIEALRYE